MIKGKQKRFTLIELEKSKTSRPLKSKRYFTLIELIIVIVVIGILVGMALPKFTGVIRNSKVAAMVTDIDTLEKAIMMYQQDNDTLPILDSESTQTFSLSLLENDDMSTIYDSLLEVLKLSEDSEETLYKINLDESGKYHSKTKYGYEKTENDFYVYSTTTGNIYYYGYLVNGKGEYNHNEIPISLSSNELVKKLPSKPLDNSNSNVNIENGTIDNPYIVNTIEELDAIRGGIIEGYDTTKHYKLGNDIDLNSISNWIPIPNFTGSLDGNGYTINNLKINKNTMYTGLFEKATNSTIKNLNLKNVNIIGDNYTGGIVGSGTSVIFENCSVQGVLKGKYRMGGIIGSISKDSTIKNCYTNVSLKPSDINNLPEYLGGIVGDASGNFLIEECKTDLSCTSSAYSVGGIVGISNKGEISKSIANVSIHTNINAGGIVGDLDDTIVRNNYSTGTIIANSQYAGGIVGYSFGDNTTPIYIEKNYSTATIQSGLYAGGIIARAGNGTGEKVVVRNNVALNNSINNLTSSNITRFNRVVGIDQTNGSISNNYASSSMGRNTNVQSFVSELNGLDGSNISLDNAKKAQPYINLGWDFENIWTIKEGQSYPTLQWENN